MEGYEELLRGLNEKLEIQNRELISIKSKLEPNSKWKKGDKCSARNYRGPPRYQTNSSMYHRNNDGDCCYKEYTTQERVYFPQWRPFGGSMGDHRTWPKEERYLNHRNIPDYSVGRVRPDSDSQIKSPRVSEAVLKVRQNHLPFIVDKAVQVRTCQGCKRAIKKNSALIIHKEIVAYASEAHGWDKPMYSKDPVANFYHFEKSCLTLRGFEDTYLSLCYIEVCERVGLEDRAKIHAYGFRRPIKTRVKQANLKQHGGPTASETEEGSVDSRQNEGDKDQGVQSQELGSEVPGAPPGPHEDCTEGKEVLSESEFDFCN